MTAPNQSHQSGHARAYIEYNPFSPEYRLYLFNEQHYAEFDHGSIVFKPLQEGVVASTPTLSWTDRYEDAVIDMFKAVGKALEIYSDEPSLAYKQGYAEGKAEVLREWNQSLRGT